MALALREKASNSGGLLDEDEGDDVCVNSLAPGTSHLCRFQRRLHHQWLAAGYSLDAIFNPLREKTPPKASTGIEALSYNRLFSLRQETGVLSTIYDLAGASLSITGFMKGIARESYRNMLNMSWLKVPGFFTTAGVNSTCARTCCL